VRDNITLDMYNGTDSRNGLLISGVNGFNIFLSWFDQNSTTSLKPDDYLNFIDVTGTA
jgi:hypothetical protein